MMEISALAGSAAMSTAVRQLQAVNEAQMAVMKQIADSQQEMATLLEAMGIGQQLDIQA